MNDELYSDDGGFITESPESLIPTENKKFKNYNVVGRRKENEETLCSDKTICSDDQTVNSYEKELDVATEEYKKTNWINDVTPLNENNLNHIEQGIYNNRLSILNMENASVPKRLDAISSVSPKASDKRLTLYVDADGEDAKITLHDLKDRIISSVNNKEEALTKSEGAYIFIKED